MNIRKTAKFVKGVSKLTIVEADSITIAWKATHISCYVLAGKYLGGRIDRGQSSGAVLAIPTPSLYTVWIHSFLLYCRCLWNFWRCGSILAFPSKPFYLWNSKFHSSNPARQGSSVFKWLILQIVCSKFRGD